MSIILALTASIASAAPTLPPSPAFALRAGDAPVMALGRHDRRDGGRRVRHRGGGGAIVYSDRDYQGDSAWRSDSFNDWWHDNPERSYPRWMQNGNCDRQWFAGDTLRC